MSATWVEREGGTKELVGDPRGTAKVTRLEPWGWRWDCCRTGFEAWWGMTADEALAQIRAEEYLSKEDSL